MTAAIEVRVEDPAAELPTVRPALVIAGRSLTRELSAAPDLTGRGPGGLRPHPGAAHPTRAGTVQKLRPAATVARKVMGDE